VFEGQSDWGLIEYMGEATRYESSAMAQRLLAVGELYARRARERAECQLWAVDVTDAVAAEVSAVQNISHARAVAQVGYARTLTERLPAVAKVFLRGTIDDRMVSTLITRTHNVDDEVIGALDEALAARVEKWMKLSKPKLRDRIDKCVAQFDAAGVRIPAEVEEHRYVDVEPSRSVGLAFLTGHLRAADGAAFDQRLAALAATVCDHDPRSEQQCRADACGALGRNEATLACLCGRDDCPAAGRRAAAAVVIHVLADQATLDGHSDKPGYLKGFGILPAETVRDLAATATVKPLSVPNAEAVPGYRPAATTQEFLRWRDLTCRWPGCDKPAERCDIDHTVPWPAGPTHPSNLKHYCRTHHLIKTFYTGPNGWRDTQLPDGTVLLTAPTGHIYASQPHGAALFPPLGHSTGALDLPAQMVEPGTDRCAMMPRRKQTRDQDRRDRITAERRQRNEINAQQERQHQAWLATTYEPPPF